jgi:type II secretory pathway pseudopilin PulG
MQHEAHLRRTPPHAEEGFVLVAVMFLLAILVLSLAVAIPRIKDSIERDREIETMHRGKQYARAVKLYYKKFGAYPPSMDALVMTNNIRFLRKRYKDPITGADDWRPIHFGENKTPIAMGFFGEPLALSGSTVAGTGVSGGNSLNGSGGLFSDSGSISSSTGSTGTSGSATSASGSSGTSTGTNSTGSAFGGSSSSSSTGQTFGGAGIIGFAPGSNKHSILLYKKKDHFNDWEFLYSPAADRVITSGSAPTTGTSSTPASTGSTFGGTGTTGSSSGSGSTTTP